MKRSRYARVMGLGASSPIWMPYLVAVISKNCISRRMLFKALINKSRVLYIGLNCELFACGSLILAISAPTNWT